MGLPHTVVCKQAFKIKMTFTMYTLILWILWTFTIYHLGCVMRELRKKIAVCAMGELLTTSISTLLVPPRAADRLTCEALTVVCDFMLLDPEASGFAGMDVAQKFLMNVLQQETGKALHPTPITLCKLEKEPDMSEAQWFRLVMLKHPHLASEPGNVIPTIFASTGPALMELYHEHQASSCRERWDFLEYMLESQQDPLRRDMMLSDLVIEKVVPRSFQWCSKFMSGMELFRMIDNGYAAVPPYPRNVTPMDFLTQHFSGLSLLMMLRRQGLFVDHKDEVLETLSNDVANFYPEPFDDELKKIEFMLQDEFEYRVEGGPLDTVRAQGEYYCKLVATLYDYRGIHAWLLQLLDDGNDRRQAALV
jgi:hypothetical protein